MCVCGKRDSEKEREKEDSDSNITKPATITLIKYCYMPDTVLGVLHKLTYLIFIEPSLLR